jgi:protein disulfide-isomerase
MKKIAIYVIAATLICSMAWAEDGTWTSDFAKAKSVAAEKKLPILALFTGSDWCPWCKKLNGEVLSSDEFKAYAKDNVVLFMADFPRTTQLAKETVKQNQDLSDKYKVEGFPTVILLNAAGKELARTGYREGGGKAYVEYIKQLLKKK